MRLVKLSVQSFQCIESAELELGPGLNVLYGPNDLGKSSLAWAIRAVLLLQHNSAQHERFVSWHGGGDPKVMLTFADAEDRYWRITKVFGGTAGRSLLESSEDGRTFTTDANGRSVDEKVRKMLGWGIPAPGGAGSPRGIPDAFLLQVLLAEQDNVRKVLFDASLLEDADASGRARLTEALGALAQDPTFKKILDRAQSQHDRAFTPTGRQKKKTATSPFVDINTRIKDLTQEHEELEAKVRETAGAESRIRQLLGERDDVDQELRGVREDLAVLEARLGVQTTRAALAAQTEVHEAAIRSADELRQALDTNQNALGALEEAAAVAATPLRDTAAHAAVLEAARDATRSRLDALTLTDLASERRRTDLEATLRVAHGTLHAARGAEERGVELLCQASESSAVLAKELAQSAAASAAATVANAASTSAANTVTAARQAVADAEQRLRDTTSSDKARARELTRATLRNRQLARQAERTEAAATVQRAAVVKAVVAKAATEASTCVVVTAELATAKHKLEAELGKLADIDARLAALTTQERCGDLREARDALTAATRAAADAQRLRGRASELQAEAAGLRASVRPTLPTSETLAGLRTLREELRIAEGKLAVGLSITLRPRRAVVIRTTVDGSSQSTATIQDELTVSAKRLVTLQIDDLVEVEISAGAETARADAARLHARWEVEGVEILRIHKLESLEDLDRLRLDADAALRAASDRQREAEAAEQRVAELSAAPSPLAALVARIAEVERELGGLDRAEPEAALAKLGPEWRTALRTPTVGIETQRQETARSADAARQQVARVEVKLEAQLGLSDAAHAEVDRQQISMPDALQSAGKAESALAMIDRDLAEVEQSLATFATAGTDEESKARNDVMTTTSLLAAAGTVHADKEVLATRGRGLAIQAATRVESARERARALDTTGGWSSALVDGSVLGVEHWQQALANHRQLVLAAKSECELIEQQLVAFATGRAAAIKSAQEDTLTADSAARAARATADALVASSSASAEERHRLQLVRGDLNTQAAGVNLETARERITTLSAQLDALGPPVAVDLVDVENQRGSVERLDGRLRDADQELAKARGGLEQVGGAVVRERLGEIEGALAQAKVREQEVLVEYNGWKLLVETLKATEAAEGAHLGRALTAPVSARFQELTGGRYGRLELGTHLESSGIQAAGELRAIDALSAGTQDQLATLLRLCVAEQLRSSIVLDDHLSQSDPGRVAWFNSVLRTAAKQIQIVVITCRPSELLSASELPPGDEVTKITAAGLLHSIDLSRVIKRFGATGGPLGERT